MEENKYFLEPDYTGHPTEDDDILDEISEDDAKIEKMLDEQAEYNNNLGKNLDNQTNNNMSSIFGSSWNPSGNTNNSTKSPWERNQNSGNSWNPGGNTGGSWNWGNNNNNSNNNYGGPSWNQNNNNMPQNNCGESSNKKIIICDVLDCLYESWESNGRPNILPRGIFDLKPRFDVWDKIASFAPQKLYIIFPAPDIIPSFGNRVSAEVTLEYLAQSITTYIRIPRRNCIVLKQMQDGLPKEQTIMGALNDWKDTKDMLYIGIHSGRYGLSSRDKDASHSCNIDYIDLYNLLSGRYEFE